MRSLSFFLCFGITILSLSAQTPVLENSRIEFIYELPDAFPNGVLQNELQDFAGIYEDPTGKLTIFDIKRKDTNGEFQKNSIQNWNYNFSSTYWLKLELKSQIDQDVLLMVGTPIILWNYIDVYQTTETGSHKLFKTGSKLFPEEKPVQDFRNYVRIDLSKRENQVLYIRFSGVSFFAPPAYMPVLHVNEELLEMQTQQFYIRDAIFFTLTGFISLFFIMFFIMTKEKSLLFISLLAMSYILRWIIAGTPEQIFYFARWFPTYQELMHFGYAASFWFMIWTLLKLSEHYLELRNFAPQWLKTHSWILLFFTFWLFPGMNFFWWVPVNLSLDERAAFGSIPLFILTLPLFEGIVVYRKGFKPAKFFIMALGLPLLGQVAVAIALFSLIIDSSYSTLYDIFIGIITPIFMGISATFLALGVGFKRNELEKEKKAALLAHSESLEAHNKELNQLNTSFKRFVPLPFLQSLGKESVIDVKVGDMVEKEVSVIFSDIRSYTSRSEKMTPFENFRFIKDYAHRMGPIINDNKGFINQYLGDGIMAIFQDSPVDALQAAVEMQAEIREFSVQQEIPVKVGMGIHTGPLIMGIIGDDNRADATTISDTVNTTSRVESLTKIYGANILITEIAVKKIPEVAPFHFRYLGTVYVKGKQQAVGIYECIDGDTTSLIEKKVASLNIFEEGLDEFFKEQFRSASEAFNQILKRDPEDQVTEYFLIKATQYSRSGAPKGWTGVEKFGL